ncbi:hypothetical protein, conserved [Plasmodium gonderi]|uniref:WD domain, G-beta repeat domain containing protein n=1 Tax=Plasmodium gonderi TaxID=77519 RepID=A0A1Y1JMJ7_PLAGO|nr:hypothetical protein, conserved [Plasmodium gonderi]GAW83681.1 hypothetical protein, conserved [Plasmodium gonderi]
MEQVKLIVLYENQDILMLNAENERCEMKFETTLKDEEKKLYMLKNGSFLVLSVNKKMVSKYICGKSSPICTKHVRVQQLNVIKVTQNEKIILGGDKFGNIYIWSSLSGLLINTFQAHYGIVKDILIDQILNVIYTYSDDNIINVYNLPDLFRKKKKIIPMLRYQHSINSSIKQIISITPNMYSSYYSLITLTRNGNIHIWGLKSKDPIHILKTQSENCTYICTNDPFNTHLYLCKGNKIFRIPLMQIAKKNKINSSTLHENQNTPLESKEDIKLSIYGDYIQVRNGKINQSEGQNRTTQFVPCKDDHHDESFVNFKKCTAFIGHKNEVLKCHVNNKKEIMITLARDGIKLWDIYNCYVVKTLKYGENIIDFFVPTITKQFLHTSSYFIEFPHLLHECEDDVVVNIVDLVTPNVIEDSYNNSPLSHSDENLLLHMATMFSGREI